MIGFEQRISGAGIDYSTTSDTTTAYIILLACHTTGLSTAKVLLVSR